MELFYSLLPPLAFSASLMLVLWVEQCMSEDASVVDAAWAFCIGLATVYYCFSVDAPLVRKLVIGGLSVIWSFRLTYYLLVDRVIGKDEDGRYRALREHWGERANFYHFFFFQAQSLLAVFLSATFLILLDNPTPHITIGEWAAVILWIVALSGEILADSQLAKFRANPINKGQTCNIGLWKFSRHPNYFFEWLLWVSYAIAGVFGGSNYGFLTLIPAVVMYIFVTRISGIPYTELQAVKSRGESYRRYQSQTNAFFPWFPKEA